MLKKIYIYLNQLSSALRRQRRAKSIAKKVCKVQIPFCKIKLFLKSAFYYIFFGVNVSHWKVKSKSFHVYVCRQYCTRLQSIRQGYSKYKVHFHVSYISSTAQSQTVFIYLLRYNIYTNMYCVHISKDAIF